MVIEEKTCKDCKWFREKEVWVKKLKGYRKKKYCMWEHNFLIRWFFLDTTTDRDEIFSLKTCENFKQKKKWLKK